MRTGVTALHPRGRAGPGDPWVAGCALAERQRRDDRARLDRRGGHADGPDLPDEHPRGRDRATPAIVALDRRARIPTRRAWLLPVASETWDGYLNDINGGHVTEAVGVACARRRARRAVEEGSVGGGTGMNCYDFKGGSGPPRVRASGTTYTVGVFVQANFGAREELTIAGVPVGAALATTTRWRTSSPRRAPAPSWPIVATDAPLLAHQCSALARRVTLGAGRTGTAGSHFSGDLFLALSTGNPRAFPTNPRRSTARPATGCARCASSLGRPGPVLRGGRPGHRGGDPQRARRQRGDDRAGRSPHARAPPGSRRRAAAPRALLRNTLPA